MCCRNFEERNFLNCVVTRLINRQVRGWCVVLGFKGVLSGLPCARKVELSLRIYLFSIVLSHPVFCMFSTAPEVHLSQNWTVMVSPTGWRRHNSETITTIRCSTFYGTMVRTVQLSFWSAVSVELNQNFKRLRRFFLFCFLRSFPELQANLCTNMFARPCSGFGTHHDVRDAFKS